MTTSNRVGIPRAQKTRAAASAILFIFASTNILSDLLDPAHFLQAGVRIASREEAPGLFLTVIEGELDQFKIEGEDPAGRYAACWDRREDGCVLRRRAGFDPSWG
jgi:hypothetical protein